MKQLNELTEWSHFVAVLEDKTVIGRKINSRVAICQNYTINDKEWSAPVDFGLKYYKFKTLSLDEVTRYKQAGWFNENFYKVYERYQKILKQERKEAA